MFLFNKKKKLLLGFTFVELIMVIFIFGTLASIIVFNYKNFSELIKTQNLAQEIALEIRKAQVESIIGRNPLIFNVGKKPSYGVYFNLIDTNNKFIFFADIDNDGFFIEGIDKKINEFYLPENYFFSLKSADQENLNKLTIIFKRPKTEAIFKKDEDFLYTNYVLIEINSPLNISKAIKISILGEINIIKGENE